MNAPVTLTISIDQLCVGLYVHLDMSWLEHSFMRNSFTIKDDQQIAAIKRLGIKTIRVEPARCSTRPLPRKSNDETQVETVLTPDSDEIEMRAAKKARIERIATEREAIFKCEKEFIRAGATFKKITQNLFSRPQDVYHDADQLIQQMLDALMTQKSVAIHLMNDKYGGEDAYYHSLNVSVLAMMLAKELSLPEQDIKALGIGCLFHDIGKVEIPDRITKKTFALTQAEKNLMQMHCHYGLTIGRKLDLPNGALDIIMQHHEYADGSGYPNKLSADDISILARIVCVINAYDNHCNPINPDESLSPYEALSKMFKQQRALFDPPALNVFIRCMGVYPPGTLVKLSDASIGMVIAVDTGKPLRPTVLIYDPSVQKNEAIIIDLSTETDLDITGSLKVSQLSPEAYDYLSPRKRTSYFLDISKH